MEYFFNFEKIAYLKDKKRDGCILCKMREGDSEIINTIVHQTEDTAVSLNLYPYNPGHILIFPLRHAEDIRNLTKTERHSLDAMVDTVLDVLDTLYNPAGYNIGFNMGLEAGASIKHLHLHVIPRYARELGIAELLGGKRVLVEDLNRTMERLKEAFAGNR
jgi:ATP adenylyltransferase